MIHNCPTSKQVVLRDQHPGPKAIFSCHFHYALTAKFKAYQFLPNCNETCPLVVDPEMVKEQLSRAW